jgi:predicted MFS family arabinose efflux permease
MSTGSFHRVVAAEVISTFGSLMSRLAIPWLAVLVLDASASAMALLAVADVAAGALAALLLGALVDRWPKRRAMIAADLARAAMLATVPAMALVGQLTIGWLVVVVAVNGALTVAFELAQSAWIARSSAQADLTQRNAALAAGNAATEAASFGITGWLFQWFGAVTVMVADACTYLASALLLARVEEPPPVAAEPGAAQAGAATLRCRAAALAREVRAGLRATLAQPVLRALALVDVLTAFAMSFAATTYMIYVARDVGLSTGVLGLLFALGGIGSLAGSWLTARTAGRIDARTWLAGSLALWAAGSLAAPLATTAMPGGMLLIGLQQLVGDAGAMGHHIADRTLRQTHAEPALLARIDASVRTLGYSATLIGALLAGALAEHIGARAVLFASSALLGVAALAAWLLLRARAR